MLIQKKTKTRAAIFDWCIERIRSFKMWFDSQCGFYFLRRRAARKLGYVPDLKNPKTYNEKIQWRKAYDRNPVFPFIADKLGVREFVAQQLGAEAAAPILSRIYHSTADPEDIGTLDLPDSYAMKANHSCGWNIFVTPEEPADIECMKTEARRWMRRSHGKTRHEWAYQPVKRQIMFEELILDGDGCFARDIKFAVFNGKCQFIVAIDGRFDDHCWYHMTPDWTRLISTPPSAVDNPDPLKPNGFDEMLLIAEKVSTGFDYFRVDFLYTPDRFVLNEITLYDASGLDPLDPPIWDQKFGAFWTLPGRYEP